MRRVSASSSFVGGYASKFCSELGPIVPVPSTEYVYPSAGLSTSTSRSFPFPLLLFVARGVSGSSDADQGAALTSSSVVGEGGREGRGCGPLMVEVDRSERVERSCCSSGALE